MYETLRLRGRVYEIYVTTGSLLVTTFVGLNWGTVRVSSSLIQVITLNRIRCTMSTARTHVSLDTSVDSCFIRRLSRHLDHAGIQRDESRHQCASIMINSGANLTAICGVEWTLSVRPLRRQWSQTGGVCTFRTCVCVCLFERTAAHCTKRLREFADDDTERWCVRAQAVYLNHSAQVRAA